MTSLFLKLDLNFPDDDKIVAAGLDGAGLYVQACCMAKRLLTDGRLTRPQLYRLGGDDELIDRLVGLGLFTVDAHDAVRIAAWAAHHAPASEVINPTKGGRLAHVRWHEKKGVHKPDCSWCNPTTPVDNPPDGPSPQVNADACGTHPPRNAIRDAQHAMPETETETETYLSSSQSESTTTPASTDNPEDRGKPPALDRQARATTACVLIGTRNHETRAADPTQPPIGNPARHLAACQTGAINEHLADAQRLAHTHPDWTPERIADELAPRATIPAETSTHPALVAQRHADAARHEPPPPPADPDHVARELERARQALHRTPSSAA